MTTTRGGGGVARVAKKSSKKGNLLLIKGKKGKDVLENERVPTLSPTKRRQGGGKNRNIYRVVFPQREKEGGGCPGSSKNPLVANEKNRELKKKVPLQRKKSAVKKNLFP